MDRRMTGLRQLLGRMTHRHVYMQVIKDRHLTVNGVCVVVKTLECAECHKQRLKIKYK